MKSPNQSYLPEIDQLRGGAAALVFFYHSYFLCRITEDSTFGLGGQWPRARYFFDSLLLEGHSGVTLFMVLSGYILARASYGRTICYHQFLQNRVLRIVPVMILAFVFALSGTREFGNLEQVLATFFFFANTKLAMPDATSLTAMFWAISVEFQFYLVAPWIFKFTATKGLRAFLLPLSLLLFVLKLVVTAANFPDPTAMWSVSYWTIAGRANQFLCGVLLWTWHAQKNVLITSKINAVKANFRLLAVFFLIFAAAQFFNSKGGLLATGAWRLFAPEVEALLWAGFLSCYLEARPLNNFQLLRSLAESFGRVSYSFYVFHFALLKLFWNLYHLKIPGPVSSTVIGLLSVGILFPLSCAIGTLSFRCIEEPFLSLRKRYTFDRPSQSATLAVSME